MKIFNLSDGNEMLEAKADSGTSLYTCDSGYSSNKYVMGGNNGALFYLTEGKGYD